MGIIFFTFILIVNIYSTNRVINKSKSGKTIEWGDMFGPVGIGISIAGLLFNFVM